MAASQGYTLTVNDNGPAFFEGNSQSAQTQQGFVVGLFATPPGYKPIGPVSVFATGCTTAYVAARMW